MTRLFRTLLSCALLLGAGRRSRATTFDFETNLVRQSVPFTDTIDSLSATFTGSGSVCNSQGFFSSLSDRVLVQSLCGSQLEFGPVSISFSSDISDLSLNFATAGGLSDLTLTAFEDAMLVGSTTVTPGVPSGYTNGEGFAVITGTFNNVTLSVLNFLAVDNVSATPALATPEPGAVGLMLAGLILVGLVMLGGSIRYRVFTGTKEHLLGD